MSLWRCGFVLGLLLVTMGAQADVHDSVSDISPYEKNSAIGGKLDADSECGPDKRNPQVWLSIGQILLYQVEVPVNGSYEFHVVPGKYDLVATTQKGCLAETQITVEPKQVAQANLHLVPSRTPASTQKGGFK